MGLREELLRRRELDQAPMRKMIGKAFDPELQEQFDAAVRENTEWLRGVIHRQGWPGQSSVGEEGAEAAWLLAQHADHDPAFQRECLNLLEVAVADGEASKRNLAYLTDRVLVTERGKQIYGTQLTWGTDGLEPPPIEDPESVDQRRSEMGLAPLARYRRLTVLVFAVASARVIFSKGWRRAWGIARTLCTPAGRHRARSRAPSKTSTR